MFKRFALLVAAMLLLLSACTPRDLAEMVMDASDAARVAASADVDPTAEPTARPTTPPDEPDPFALPSAHGAPVGLDGYFPEQMEQMADFDMSEEEKLATILLSANFDAAIKHDYERAAQYNVNYLEIVETNTDYLDSLFYETEGYVVLGTGNVERDGDAIYGNVAYEYKVPRVSAVTPFLCYDEFVIDVSEEPIITYFDTADAGDADRRAGVEAIRQRAEEFGIDNYLDYLDFGTRAMDVPDAKELVGFDGAVEVTYPYGWVGNVLPEEMTVDLYSADFEARGTISILDMTENGEGMSLEEIGNALFETLDGTVESDESGMLNGMDGHMLEGSTTFEISDYNDVCAMRVFVVQSEDRERVYAVIGIFDENTLAYEEDAAYGIMESLVVR